MSLVVEVGKFILSVTEKLDHRKLGSSTGGAGRSDHSSSSESTTSSHEANGWELSTAPFCHKFGGHGGSTIGKSICGPTYTLSLSFIMYETRNSMIISLHNHMR